jgi:thioredoxin 1
MAPVMDDLAKSYDNRLKIVKMEVDPNPESVKTYKVEGVPALRLFLNGTVLESKEGAMNKQKVEAMLSAHV